MSDSHRQNPASPADLRHMTSNTLLASPTKDHHHRPGRRTSQHLRTDARLGSPNSIPSSPTSVHSSSSAIFERDIEPILPPSPPTSTNQRPLDPHRIPRARTTEQLEQAVPSVLDSAAAILTEPALPDTVAVVAPAAASSAFAFDASTAPGSGFASPLSLRSRSPSPLGSRSGGAAGAGAGGAASPTRQESLLLLNIPPQSLTAPDAPSSLSLSPGPMARSTSTSSTAPPNTNTTASASSPTSQMSSHPPSPSHGLSKRLSFMSYSDLLSSTPASTHTLSSLTTSASSTEPPPHIPSVSGLNLVSAAASVASATASAAGSLRNFSISPPAVHCAGKRDSVILDNVGGEWEREGFGSSLEARLEGEVAGALAVGASPAGGVQGAALPVCKA